MIQIAPEYKIQLASCELYPKSLLGLPTVEEIRSTDVYIFCEFFFLLPSFPMLYLFCWFVHTSFHLFHVPEYYIFSISVFGQSVIHWSSDTHLKQVFLFNFYIQYAYFWVYVNLMINWIYYLPFPFYVAETLFS